MIDSLIGHNVEVIYLEGDKKKICSGNLEYHNSEFLKIEKGVTVVLLNVANVIEIIKKD